MFGCLVAELVAGEKHKRRLKALTIKAFAEKYQLPYQTVYNATYYVHSKARRGKNREYPEQELKEALHHILTEKLERVRSFENNVTDMIDRLGAFE